MNPPIKPPKCPDSETDGTVIEIIVINIKLGKIDLNAEENILLFGENLNSKDMTYIADKLIKKGATRVAVFTESAAGCSFVLISTEKDAKTYADEMKECLGLKGGGKNESIQGRVDANKTAVKEYFESKGFNNYE